MTRRRLGVLLAGAICGRGDRHRPQHLPAHNDAGFKTSTPVDADTVRQGVQVDPLMTVRRRAFRAAIASSPFPDGISHREDERATEGSTCFVNHETSTVPFPLPTPTAAGGADFVNSNVSKLRLHQNSAGDPEGRLRRFRRAPTTSVSARTTWPREGTRLRARHPLHERRGSMTTSSGQERRGRPSPVPSSPAVVVALDVKSGAYKSIYGMGRHNHENSVAIPELRGPGTSLG